MQPKHIAQLLFLRFPAPGEVDYDLAKELRSAQQKANRNCLYWLKNRGYVKVIDAPIRQGDLVYSMELCTITKMGFDTLQQHRASLNLDFHPSLIDPISVIFDRSFEHWLIGMESAVAAEADFRSRGGSVLLYWDDYEIRQRSKRRKDGINWGGLEPDGLIIGELNGERFAFLPEIDRGFQPVSSDAANSIRTKGKKYKDFFIHYRQADPLLQDMRQPTVQFLSNSAARIKTIRDEIEDLGGRQSYWYSTFDWIQPPYSYLGEVWQVSGREGYHSPIKRILT